MRGLSQAQGKEINMWEREGEGNLNEGKKKRKAKSLGNLPLGHHPNERLVTFEFRPEHDVWLANHRVFLTFR